MPKRPIDERRVRRRLNQRRYYRKNAERLRDSSRARDAANPEDKSARNARFEAKNPTYWRDYQRRRRLKLAWRKFCQACAVARRVRLALMANDKSLLTRGFHPQSRGWV